MNPGAVLPADRAAVATLLGHQPRGHFEVVVRGKDGGPVVIRNAPLLDDGTPMPTRYWLVGKLERDAVSRLESQGAGRRIEAMVDPAQLADAHARYEGERSAAVPAGHTGPVPTGGVGGARKGVKCLHAHLAWYLAGGDDPVGRQVARELAGPPVAAVDCGTNSTRLLIAAPWTTGLVALEREMRITRLGEGVDGTGQLDPAAVGRTVEVLRHYASMTREYGVGTPGVLAVATSAVRDAANGEVFLDQAAEVLGVRPEVLTGEREGATSFAGATAGLPSAGGPYLVVDIGGGSTELIAGDRQRRVAAWVSLDVGCVRVTERYLPGDPPGQPELLRARSEVRAMVDGALAAHPALGSPPSLIGLAGTVAALASIEQGLDRYDRTRLHHHVLRREVVERLLAELSSQPLEARRRRRGLEPGRAEVIVGGALVLAEVMAALDRDQLLTSESDILDGIAAELVGAAAT